MNNSQVILKVVEFKDPKYNRNYKYTHFYKDSFTLSNEILSIEKLQEYYKESDDAVIDYTVEFDNGEIKYNKVLYNNEQRQAFEQLNKAINNNTFLKVDHETFSLMTIDNLLLHHNDIEKHKENNNDCWKVGDIIRLFDYHPNYDMDTFYKITKINAKSFMCEELKNDKIIQCIYEKEPKHYIIDTIYKIDFNTHTGIKKRFKNDGPTFINYKITEPYSILKRHKEILI